MNYSSNVVRDSNDLPHKLLLNNTQVPKICRAFGNDSSADIKLSKAQLHKIGQSEGFLGKLLGPLLKTGLPIVRNVLKPLPTSVLIQLGLSAAVSVTDASIHKKMFRSGNTTFIILNWGMNDLMKTVKSLEKFGLLIKVVN